jgi:hypothetical protein
VLAEHPYIAELIVRMQGSPYDNTGLEVSVLPVHYEWANQQPNLSRDGISGQRGMMLSNAEKTAYVRVAHLDTKRGYFDTPDWP